MSRMERFLACVGLVALLGCVSDTPVGGDGGVDSGSDGTPATDSPADSPPPDGGSQNWCAANRPQVTLCDDFDLLTTPRPEWASSGATLAVDTTAYQSQPRALHVTVAPSTSAFLSLQSTTSPTTSILEAGVRLVQDGTTSPNAIGVLTLSAGGGQKLVFTVLPGTSDAGTQDARCAVLAFGNTTPFTQFPFARGTWHTVVLKIEPGANSTYNLTCSVDNIDHGWTGATATGALGSITATVGLVSPATGTAEAHLDNVSVDFK